MRVSNIAINTELKNVHPGYLDFVPKHAKQPNEQSFICEKFPQQSLLNKHRLKVCETNDERINILKRLCAIALIAIGAFMIGQVSYEFFEQPVPHRAVRLGAAKTASPIPRDQFEKLEKIIDAIVNVLEFLINQQQITASTPTLDNISIQGSKPSLPLIESHDLHVVEVHVRKANLRVGPGIEHSPLMTVAKDTQLAVEMEQDGWYRILAPNGARAWISSTVVQ